MRNSLVVLLFFMFLVGGCSLADPISKAQSLAKKGEYERAITLLEEEHKTKPSSVPVTSLLAQFYSDYGLTLCQDVDKPPAVKYPRAKEQFAMALALNPYLNEAKEMYEIIEKIQASLKANNVQ